MKQFIAYVMYMCKSCFRDLISFIDDFEEVLEGDFFPLENRMQKSAFRIFCGGQIFIYLHMLLLLGYLGKSGVISTGENSMLRFVGERAACYNKNNDINRSFGVQDLEII